MKLVYLCIAALALVALAVIFSIDASADVINPISTVSMMALYGDLDWYEKAAAIYTAITTIIGAFAQLAAITPTSKDNKFLSKVSRVIHLLGVNFGFARNKH